MVSSQVIAAIIKVTFIPWYLIGPSTWQSFGASPRMKPPKEQPEGPGTGDPSFLLSLSPLWSLLLYLSSRRLLWVPSLHVNFYMIPFESSSWAPWPPPRNFMQPVLPFQMSCALFMRKWSNNIAQGWINHLNLFIFHMCLKIRWGWWGSQDIHVCSYPICSKYSITILAIFEIWKYSSVCVCVCEREREREREREKEKWLPFYLKQFFKSNVWYFRPFTLGFYWQRY
jgi:hypothetical protein